MFNHSELVAFAVALLASLGLTVPIRHLALRYGMVDKPGPRKVHLNPIPLLGGIAIYLGFVLAVVLTRHDAPVQQIIGILAGATLLAIVGFLDDGGLLHHQVKLFIGMPLAAIFLIASGIRTGIGLFQLKPWARRAALLWASVALCFCLYMIAFRPFETFFIPDRFVSEVESFKQLLAISLMVAMFPISIWWIFFFRLPSVKRQFEPPAPSEAVQN